MPTGFEAARTDARFGIGHFGQQALTVFEECCAFVCERDAAGATPSAFAAAVKLPFKATDTKDSKALSLSMLQLSTGMARRSALKSEV
jgi:hypothetical protein